MKSLLTFILAIIPCIRIFGGTPAEPQQFPWQTAIYYETANGTNFCSGALISDQWILTAAQCTLKAEIFTLFFGSNKLEGEDPNRVITTTSYCITNEHYTPDLISDDVGLIWLETPLEFTDYIQPISMTDNEIGGGIGATVSGWGSNSTGIVTELSYANLTTMSNDDCIIAFIDQLLIQNSQMCAVGQENEGTCSGDTGSPLVILGETPTLIGLASFVKTAGCGQNFPSGFTKISEVRQWIRNNTGI